ncbi:MAG: hypothetical protein ACXVYM_05280 [Gaiellaceae bacterium]
MKALRAGTLLLALLLVAVGAGILVRTALAGGGVGLLLGPLFMLAGVGRLYLALRR